MDKFPDFIEPMKASLVEHLPANRERYAYELKWDGYRALAYWDEKTFRLTSRNDLDFTFWYPELHDLKKQLKQPVILDGEVVALDEKGKPAFQLLQQRSGIRTDKETAERMKNYPVQYYIFDVLYASGSLLLKKTYRERRKILKDLKLSSKHWSVPPHEVGKPENMIQAAKEHGIEGIIAKLSDSLYVPGKRSRSWLKIKFVKGQEFLVVGFTEGQGAFAATFGSLLLGYYDEEHRLRYAGYVGTGFSYAQRAEIRKALEKIEIKRSEVLGPVPITRQKPFFVKPLLMVEIAFTEITHDKQIRHPSFKGFRFDKNPDEITLEKAVA